MTAAADAIEVARHWDAPLMAGYADGGARWHLQIHLVRHLDDEAPRELLVLDLYSESLAMRPGLRSQAREGRPISAPMRPLTLLPGDPFLQVATEPAIVRLPSYGSPYGEECILDVAVAAAN
jgi:hypothetical protein